MKNHDFPANVIELLLGEDAEAPADFVGTLYYVLSGFSTREAETFILYYSTEMDYSGIGKRYGVTRERIRQIVAKTTRKLQHFSRRTLLEVGIRENMAGIEVKAYTRGYEDGYKNGKEKANAEIARSDADADDYLQTPIERMDLSVRTFNCLVRAGVRTVGDVVDMGRENVMKVRNLGRKSYDELVNKLVNTYHLPRSEWGI